jgi:hypothetical protein
MAARLGCDVPNPRNDSQHRIIAHTFGAKLYQRESTGPRMLPPPSRPVPLPLKVRTTCLDCRYTLLDCSSAQPRQLKRTATARLPLIAQRVDRAGRLAIHRSRRRFHAHCKRARKSPGIANLYCGSGVIPAQQSSLIGTGKILGGGLVPLPRRQYGTRIKLASSPRMQTCVLRWFLHATHHRHQPPMPPALIADIACLTRPPILKGPSAVTLQEC